MKGQTIPVERLREVSDRLLDATPTETHRSLYKKIDWRNRMVCLKGARGTGKSTLLRQHLAKDFGHDERAIYMTLDYLWISAPEFLDVIDTLYKDGVTTFYLDEVHHLKDWAALLKNIYDCYPDVSVRYSGSSLLKIGDREGDLSRRQAAYELPGLSFREYLAFEGVKRVDAVPLGDLLRHHREIAAEAARGIKILPLFRRYLESGYYPFYREAPSGYSERVFEVVNKVLDSDLPTIEDVTPATIRKTKRMLSVLAASCPQMPNMSRLYRELETDRNQGFKMLDVLERARLLMLVSSGKDKLDNLSRAEKIYCDNTNLMQALTPAPDVGTLRETFFVNPLRAAGHGVCLVPKGDFKVDGRFLFEIGGKGKGFDQIRDLPDSFVAADEIEIGSGNKVPLWVFGLLY